MSFYPCLPNLPSFKKFNVFQPPRQLTETLKKQDDIPGSYLLWMIRKQGMNPTCVQLVCGENTWQPWPANSLFYCNGFGIPEVTTSKLVGDDQNVTTPTPPKFDIDTDQILQMLKGNTFYIILPGVFVGLSLFKFLKLQTIKRGIFFWVRLTRMNRQNRVRKVPDPKVHLGDRQNGAIGSPSTPIVSIS